MKSFDIYGTLGPSLCSQKDLYDMFMMGMTGVRLNLSHVDLVDCETWLKAFHDAARQAGIDGKLLIDMKGPELRIGKLLEPLDLVEGMSVDLNNDILIPQELACVLNVGRQLLLDDGRILLEVIEVHTKNIICSVIHGGMLTSGKSIALVDETIAMPTLTTSDIRNLKVAKQYGVTGIMQPFVRSAQDLITVKKTLDEIGATSLQVFAKIENMEGVKHIKEIVEHCDHIVIARGDLGNAMPLWQLPSVQMEIQNVCKACQKPYMVVTQMLDSMISHPVPTRAEVSDVFYAVYHGASSIMLTGETAAGKYPLEAMCFFTSTAKSALQYCKDEIEMNHQI